MTIHTSTDRADIEMRWLELTKITLPEVAGGRDWPIKFDHCFQRVLLDNACDGVWYDHIEGRPAYKWASDATLVRAIKLGQAVLVGSEDLVDLNNKSLDWRGKKRNP
ncbi:hypothetical protein [Litoreibacter roseus]|nr:hypothetical protein [Litoreibacter roseus]